MIVNFLRISVALALLGYIASTVNWARAFEALRDGDIPLILAGTFALALQPLVGALRWYVVLTSNRASVRLGEVTRWNYISVFAGQVLPATVGVDAMRVMYAARRSVNLKDALTSVMIDRIGMVLILIGLLFLSAPFMTAHFDAVLLDLFVVFVLIGCTGVLLVILFGDALPIRFYEIRLFKAVGHLSRDSKRLLSSWSVALNVLLLCLLSYVTLMTSIYCFVIGFGATAAAFDILMLLPLILAAGMVPISLGGWGTREVSMVAALGTVGVATESALLASLWLGVASILISLPGAVFFLLDRKTGAAAAAVPEADRGAAVKP